MSDSGRKLQSLYAQELEELIERGREMLDAVEAAKVQSRHRTWSLRDTPKFHDGYQSWFSESQAIIKQLLPDRLPDFVSHYTSSDPKEYRLVANLLQGNHGSTVSTAIGHLRQQVATVAAARSRFESSLYEIRQLVAADLFDSELAAAEELVRKGFLGPAGVVAGVVLEQHLKEVCQQRGIAVPKQRPTIGDLNGLLKKHGVVDVPGFRRIGYMADIRNLCGHKRERDPKREEVEGMIAEVAKTVKTLF